MVNFRPALWYKLTVMYCPMIRYVEAIPLEQEGRDMILLRDTENIIENSLVVSQDVVFLISLMDGKRTLREIQAEYMRAFGQLIYMEHIEKLVETLDTNLLLNNDNFRKHLACLKEEYENEPVRKARLAGKSYPANRMDLLMFLDDAINGGNMENREPVDDITGILAPHIDYARGIGVYKTAYSYLKDCDKPLVIVLGTCHHYMDHIWSISLKDCSTPLEKIPNPGGLRELIKNDEVLRNYIDEWPHRNEHSIELQLPLIQFTTRHEFEMLPILTGSMHEYISGEKTLPDQEFEDIIGSFKSVLDEYGKPYVIISGADLAHIGAQFGDRGPLDSYTLTRSKIKDKELLDAIKDVDAGGFFSIIREEQDSRRICGLTTIYFQLRLLDDSRCSMVGYDQWTDGKSSVSFAGGVFYRG